MAGVSLRNTLIVTATLLSGCAFGNRHAYHNANANVNTKATHAIAVGVLDGRGPILEGKKDPNWVGFNRGGYGNTFDVATATGNPLSADMAASACASLQGAGFTCTPVQLQPGADAEAAAQTLAGQAADRKLLVVLNTWKADAYAYGWLGIDVSLRVYDGAGQLRGIGRMRETVALGGSMWNAKKAIEAKVPQVWQEKLGELLNMPEIAAALQ
jgi:hypothetical protein